MSEKGLSPIDRHHCLRSGKSPDAEAGLIVLCSSKYVTGINGGFVGVGAFHREHALAYPNHVFMTCGGSESFTSATIFKKCGVLTMEGWNATS